VRSAELVSLRTAGGNAEIIRNLEERLRKVNDDLAGASTSINTQTVTAELGTSKKRLGDIQGGGGDQGEVPAWADPESEVSQFQAGLQNYRVLCS